MKVGNYKELRRKQIVEASVTYLFESFCLSTAIMERILSSFGAARMLLEQRIFAAYYSF